MGAWVVESTTGPMELNIPAIKGIGDSLIYLVDRYGDNGSIYDVDFKPLPGADQRPAGARLTVIDQLTHKVYRERLKEWSTFHERLFKYREIRSFEMECKRIGQKSKAMTNHCAKTRITNNERPHDNTQND